MNSTVIKSERLLHIYCRLVNGETLSKRELAQKFNVTERSVQRDIEALRYFFADQGVRQDVIYDRNAKGYRLHDLSRGMLTNSEALAVCKILLESRSLCQDEMGPIIDKILSLCVPEQNKKAVKALISNEKFHYIEPQHGRMLLDGLWDVGQAIHNRQLMEIEYERMKQPQCVKRLIEPVAIMFSEYYFYLAAFLRNIDRQTEFENPDDLFPTIYRIDRIRSFKVLKEHFQMPYNNRFQEGEFRKRVQFMYGGKLQYVKFIYKGPSVEAVLDRLPTAKVSPNDDETWLVEAEVFGNGIEMWLRSQGDMVQVVEGDAV